MRIVIVYPPLPDVGFHFLPQLDQLWLTDLFDALLVFPTIVHVVFHRKVVHVAHSWFLTSTLCNVERIATVAITSFPDPRAGCEMVTSQIWTKVSAHKCGDCMFSGHTVLFVICACVWTTYPPCNQRIARVVISTIIWLLVLAGSAIVIMNRAHYTVDVLVAWYVGIGNWYIVQYFWKEQTCLTGKQYYKPVNNHHGVFSVLAVDEDHERYQSAFEKHHQPSLRLTLASPTTTNDHSEMVI
ncbi:hypothetical protein O0I10_009299 [Lichtheimia ornata]|uniref:Sphingomyelin synthase-like domain-containing protein n=1 Tax=Lichtheimia ornata TaxID=688661 RepID=A0AAD7UX67_9FUNG|nr:uncharacterized protein O0I10_009299 [Lichtheimia ornata]KAJ8655092.1 hypothetical protein O0I10_009299 [Lichtheimia ornata]